jgi:hypothetical protein
MEEVGRWPCDKCGKTCVAAGTKEARFRGIGAFAGACPWGCGARIHRSFRFIRPGAVKVYTADDWAHLMVAPVR